jgi:hypothetical protein
MANSSRSRPSSQRSHGTRTPTERPDAINLEPQVRQRARLMGRSSLLGDVFSDCAAPPPSLAITDALRRRRSS